MSRGVSFIIVVIIILALSDKSFCKKRSKRQAPIIHDVYTLDHFIELVEKIEQHPKTSTKTIATVANYIRGLMGNRDEQLWNVLLPGQSALLPDGILSKEEKRVLKDMVKHRYDGQREFGVVLVPNNYTVAMGHVINGICAGVVHNKRQTLVAWNEDAEDTVDNLIAATISGTLTRTGLEAKNDPSRALFGPGGSWKSDHLCPERYQKSSSVISNASDAQILGDVDGFLMGYNMKKWDKKGVRLGQLLRMYYSSGVCYDRSFVDCHRLSNIKRLLNKNFLFGQVLVLAVSYYVKNLASYPKVKISDISGISIETRDGFFAHLEKIAKDTPCVDIVSRQGCELPANIVFVMDESASIGKSNYSLEKAFLKEVIDSFKISPYQTRIAVVEFSDDAVLSIALNDYGSKTRLMCSIDHFDWEAGDTYTGNALKTVNDKILSKAQDKILDNTYVGERLIPQIVILLTDGKSNDPDPKALGREVSRIKNDIQGLTMIAVGIGGYKLQELQLVATDPKKHVFEANNFQGLIRMVSAIQNRTCSTPVELDINFHEGANESVVSAFVSPKRPRYFVLPKKLFLGIRNLYIEVTPIYGTVAIYASRNLETPGPYNYTYKIDPLNDKEQMILYISDPCEGYTNSTCPDVYLAIYGDSSTLSCSERFCTLPNQIKFTIKKGVKPSYGSACFLFQKSSFVAMLIFIAQAFNHDF